MKKILIAIYVVALIGFFDATYLTVVHFTGLDLVCSVTSGCDEVTTSVYSTIGPIPIALFGALYYLTMFIISAYLLNRRNNFLEKVLMFLPITGFVASLYLVYLQAFVLEAYCQYCLVSAGTSTALFILGLVLWRFFKKSENLTPVDKVEKEI